LAKRIVHLRIRQFDVYHSVSQIPSNQRAEIYPRLVSARHIFFPLHYF
jgi:hypothetical protein